MVNLLAAELLKLKRSRMLLLSLLGAAIAPIMVVLAFYINKHSEIHNEPADLAVLFYNTSMYTVLLIGVPLYTVVTAYLFNREYVENTLENLLTLPVGRTTLMLSKMLMLMLWILLLSLVAWVLTLLLGLLGGFGGLSGSLILHSLSAFVLAGLFLFALSTPVILITVMMKNYVPPIIFALSITLINVLAYNSEHRGLVPWTAAFDIAQGTLLPTYPAAVSYGIIAAMSVGGCIATLLYFRKVDVN
ncbi:ABC transporter permease [Paenibacillus donghaensis]|uniref:Bacitracin ABC transporter permease n=1 Tax=Paenibacillus donghaensis TaxID=414771 RepID=A0A2Z2KCG5_9BACL|nr:ABC transporter permease [Paenibacillus donghaensis]ASA20613.1 bacitracin ABC transporter permease [Paenibacillus donghaensis]